jgi:hypothetical protein
LTHAGVEARLQARPFFSASECAMPTEVDLLTVIRRKLATGTLPRSKPTNVWGRYGSRNTCNGCDRVVANNEVEMEVRFDARTICFHLTCYVVWEAAREEHRAAS